MVESNHHRKGRDHCQPKHNRKTLDEVLRVEREGARHGAFKVLVKCGETYCVGNAGTCGPQSADRHRKKKLSSKTVQYVRFPGGPPPEYWTRPWLLSFGDRTGSGVSNQV